MLDTPVKIVSPPNAIKARASTGRDHVRPCHLRRLQARQPGPSRSVINDSAGRVPGDYGCETGSGKSTLLSLIMRFYDVNTGRFAWMVTTCESWRLTRCGGISGWCFRRRFCSVTRWLRISPFGRPDASLPEIQRAARIACAEPFIEEMPEDSTTPWWGSMGPTSPEASGSGCRSPAVTARSTHSALR